MIDNRGYNPYNQISSRRMNNAYNTQDFDAPFLIATGELMEGEFPAKAQAMVKEFILTYQKDLEEMWEKEEYRKLPPLI